MLMASRPSSFPPSTPCAPEYSCYNTGGCHHQSYSYSPNRTHTIPPPRPSYTRSVPLHMSRGKSLIGCHVVVRAGENVTYAPHKRAIHHVHTGSVPGHHRHVTSRHFPRLMLHYSPQFQLCWSGQHSATLFVRPLAVKVLALVFSPTRRHAFLWLNVK